MKRLLTLVVLLSLSTGLAAAQALTIEPARPEAGESVLITYNTNDPAATLTGNEPLYLVDVERRDEYSEFIPMQEKDGRWSVEVETYPEVSPYVLLKVRSGEAEDTNGNDYWEFMLHEKGVPIEGAHSYKARLKSYFMDDEEVPAFRLEQYRKEYQLYAEEAPGLLGTMWKLQIDMGEDPAGIHVAARAQAEHWLTEDPNDLSKYRLATRILSQVGLDEEADAIEERYKTNPPTIEFEASFARSELSNSLKEEKTPEGRIALLESFIETYGHVSTGFRESTYGDQYNRSLLQEYIETENLQGVLSLVDAVVATEGFRPSFRQPMDLALSIARLGGDLDEARRLVRMSEERLPLAMNYDIMRPTSFEPYEFRVLAGKEAEAEAFHQANEAEVEMALAFLDAKDGRIKRALRNAEKAAPLLSESEEGLMLFGEIQLMADMPEAAFDSFRSVAMLSPGHAEARRMLKQSWVAMYATEEGYYEAVTAIEEEWKAMRSVELLEERGWESAPDFSTMLLASNTMISKEDLAGKVVVIDFWASWCGPCLKAFPDLNTTFKKYQNRDDVMFLVVNTGWSNTLEDARSFAEANDYEFPYSMDEDERMTKAFSVLGIPTTVVLDPEGREAFRHLGYEGPDYVAELSLEIDLLLGDYVVKQGTH